MLGGQRGACGGGGKATQRPALRVLCLGPQGAEGVGRSDQDNMWSGGEVACGQVTQGLLGGGPGVWILLRAVGSH